jgi:hypothetical protein
MIELREAWFGCCGTALRSVLAAGLFAVAAGAVSAADITLSVDNAAPGVGSMIAVTIHANVAAGEAFVSANQFLSFDKAKLELTEQAAGAAAGFTGDGRGLAAINASGEVHAGVFSPSAISGNLTLGVFRFKALASGTTVVTTRGYDATNAPFGNLLVKLDDTQIVPSTPGPLTITIGGEQDSDGDGIPDWWMVKYFGHPTGQAGDLSRADDDPDNDRMSNYKEYRCDTRPKDSTSFLGLTALAANGAVSGEFLVRWQSASNKTYTLQVATNLLVGFVNLRTNITATPTINLHTDSAGGAKQRFYRVVVE